MNTFDWDPSSNYLTLAHIGAISLPASALVILATLVAAFSAHVQVAVKTQWRWMRRAAVWIVPPVVKRERERRRAEKEAEQRAERERKARDRGFDFWAAVRRQRTLEAYDIPESNRGLGRVGTGGDSAGSVGGRKVVGGFMAGLRAGRG